MNKWKINQPVREEDDCFVSFAVNIKKNAKVENIFKVTSDQ